MQYYVLNGYQIQSKLIERFSLIFYQIQVLFFLLYFTYFFFKFYLYIEKIIQVDYIINLQQ